MPDGVTVPAARFRPDFFSSCSHRYPVNGRALFYLRAPAGLKGRLLPISHAHALRHVAVTFSCTYENADLFLCV